MGRTGYFLTAGLAIVILALVGVGIWFKSDTDASITELEDDLQASEASAAELREELDTAEARLADLESQVSELEADLSEASTDLTEAESELVDNNDAVSDFFAFALRSQGVEEEAAACISETMVETSGASILMNGLVDAAVDPSGGTGSVLGMGADLLLAMEPCGVVPQDMFGSFDSPNDYGDDAGLDALYEACELGTGSACDQLYYSSPFGSEYERFGATCGDRFTLAAAPDFCQGEIQAFNRRP